MKSAGIQNLDLACPGESIACDVCIVGAGPVGLTLARALAKQGKSIVILEAGPEFAVASTHTESLQFDRRPYRGATTGRSFGFGGTSSLWGGQLLPLRRDDFSGRPQSNSPAWPISHAELDPHFDMLERWFAIDKTPFHRCPLAHPLEGTMWGTWAPRWSKWLPFGKRNIAQAWRKHFANNARVQVWLNAAAHTWQWTGAAGSRSIKSIVAKSPNGNCLTVVPTTTTICAGAIEAARLVLEMNEQSEDPTSHLSTGVREFAGRYLNDHLSMRLARVTVKNRAHFQRHFAPIFQGSTMRSLRIELTSKAMTHEQLPAMYAHIVAEATATSGFAVLRDLLRCIQRGRFRDALRHALGIPKVAPELLRLVYSRLIGKRLIFPEGANLYLHIDFEQASSPENRVYLGNPDGSGRRIVHIDWDISEGTQRIAAGAQAALEALWRANAFDKLARLEFFSAAKDDDWLVNIYDIYHPAGTTRMSTDPEAGVVDANLRIHGTCNVFVAGSSVFPSMGAANPTFTAMALALRLANFIASKQDDR